ncbi:MAG: RNA polymerase sigma factor [Thermoguttaceae bacterium]|nr:RNA polymerase sigma factor [Thermoguttaceae bacterium]MDW8039532.1 RNA polymerase sigma factor [Thermoguttaceae bacterium]
MQPPLFSEKLLIDRIRAGQPEAWEELIARYEGRLYAYIIRRVKEPQTAEDIVQETFLGFLTSLPNYDAKRSLENWLFSIAAHKLTDHLRRHAQRSPAGVRVGWPDSTGWEPLAPTRPPSSLARSAERHHWEETALVTALREVIQHWQQQGHWEKITCLELLILRGWPNKQVAQLMNLSEQTVANYKFEFRAKLQAALRKQSLPEDLFPELSQDSAC